MTREEQKELLTNFCNQMRDAMLARADRWPEAWDGHELRELAAVAFDRERTRLMREDKKRAKAARNEMVVNNLY
jgi:hypothetical protein